MCNFILPFLFPFKLCATLACDPLLLQALGEKQQPPELLFQLLPSATLSPRHSRANPPEAGGWTGQGSELYPQVFTSCCARLQGSSAQPRFVWMLQLHRTNLHAGSPSVSPYASQQSWGCITRFYRHGTKWAWYNIYILHFIFKGLCSII